MPRDPIHATCKGRRVFQIVSYLLLIQISYPFLSLFVLARRYALPQIFGSPRFPFLRVFTAATNDPCTVDRTFRLCLRSSRSPVF